MKLQFSWQQVAVLGIVAAVLTVLVVTKNVSSIGAMASGLVTVLGLVAKSPVGGADEEKKS